MYTRLSIVLICVFFFSDANAQCCGGGGGSPIAGDFSFTVLEENQIEISSNYQFINTEKFLTGNEVNFNFLDKYSSNYLYNRLGFGLSERLTFSAELGYWLDKSQIGLNNTEPYMSSGAGDLIVLPRYKIYQSKSFGSHLELTVGLGFKIPLGAYNDSTAIFEPFTETYYYIQKPLSVQLSSGSQDVLFSLAGFRSVYNDFVFWGFNSLFIKRGWNPIGEKIGDFASMTLYAGTSLTSSLSAVIQIRGEWLDKMSINPERFLLSYPNYDPMATGYKKVFISPGISFSFKSRFSLFLLADIPIYQFMNETQIGSQYQLMAGCIYRISLKKEE